MRSELCVVVRNQWMTSPLGRECVFALFLECRPAKVSPNVCECESGLARWREKYVDLSC